jgi:hypothetical protein
LREILRFIPLITDAIDLALGAGALRIVDARLLPNALVEASLNSQLRLFGVIWLEFGFMM